MLFLTHSSELLQKIVNLLKISLSLLALVGHICDEQSKLWGPLTVAILNLSKELFSLSLLILEYPLKVLNFSIVLLCFNLSINVIKFLDWIALVLGFLIKVFKLTFKFLVFSTDIIGSISLILNLFVEIFGSWLQLLVKCINSLLIFLSFLLHEFLLVWEIVVGRLSFQVLFS